MNPKDQKETLDKKPPFDANDIAPDNFEGFVKARRKTPMLQVVQLNFPEGFHVDNEEGRTTGHQGDYLVIYDDKSRAIVPKEIFEASWTVLK